jgi:hypothetical protein
MQRTVTLKSFVFFSTLTLAVGCACAADGHESFEHGLRNQWSAPASEYRNGHEMRDREMRDDRFGGHAFNRDFDRHSFEEHAHQYSNCFDFSVSPVSEPQNDAMMLTGLAILAAWARRKHKASATPKALAA